jgi:hypothetical protein
MLKGAWKIMQGDTLNTTFASLFATFCSFIIAHLPEFQAFITFSLTVVFLVYKIREAKAKADIAEMQEDDERKRH